MGRQHPWLHVMGYRVLTSMTVSEIWDNCQNLLGAPRISGTFEALKRLSFDCFSMSMMTMTFKVHLLQVVYHMFVDSLIRNVLRNICIP